MAANLIETCGRYLYRTQDSHHRCKLLLDQLMRKKSLLPYDSKYITMIENAYYFANPPETQAIAREELPPMQEYIRKLICKDLTKANIDKILRLIRKLDWDNPEVVEYAVECFVSCWNVKFYNIRCVANLLAALNQYQDWVIPQVIDGVLEDIRLMMEINHSKYNQRRISVMRYLGELFNYRLIESSVIFKILYFLLTYEVYYDLPGYFSELDPAPNLFRIRLVCQLLDTCGQYFNSGTVKKKLDCFIIFFQRYFWLKKSQDFYTDECPFPVAIDFLFKDCIIALRPKFNFATNYSEAVACVENLMNELKPKLSELFPSLKVDSQENALNTDEEGRSLNPIVEVDEDQDSDGNFLDSDISEEEEILSDQENYPTNSRSKNRNTVTTYDGSDTEGEKECKDVSSSSLSSAARPPKLITCKEDDEFKKDFEKMISESMLSRGQDSTRSSINDIVVPLNKLMAAKKSVAFSDGSKPAGKDQPYSTSGEESLNLLLMTRAKGNKPMLKIVQVPIDSDLALSLKEKEEAERVEKEQVKKLTLDINERREMEDEFSEKANLCLVMNLNRETRKKYQHPKGAPDVDVIFGNK